MPNPYFPSVKDAPIKTALYTPILPFGWDTISEWINPQKKTLTHVQKDKIKIAKKSYSITAKSAKKSSAPQLAAATSAISLKPFFFVSVACTVALVALFFTVIKSK